MPAGQYQFFRSHLRLKIALQRDNPFLRGFIYTRQAHVIIYYLQRDMTFVAISWGKSERACEI